MRYGDMEKRFKTDFAGEGGFLYWMASTLLFFETEAESCRNVGMAGIERGQKLSGSLALLWPFFLSMCFSQFTETLACTLQGRHPLSETSIFEHSLAYAEAEAMVLKPFELALLESKTSNAESSSSEDTLPITRKMVLQVFNVTPEVLLMSLVSAISNLISNILAVFGLRRKMRLINTTILGITYILVFTGALVRVIKESNGSFGDASWIFRFPTVFLVGYVPHLLLIAGMASCAMIYGTAFLLTMLSPPRGVPHPSTFRERVATAYRNLQANVYLSTGNPVNFSWEDDFFTTVLKAGFALVTAASEAVYLNEGAKIKIGTWTWLEEKRLEELVQRQGLLYKRIRDSIPPELRGAHPVPGVALAEDERPDPNLPHAYSGYAIERKARSESKSEELALATGPDSGIGFLERQGRWAMAMRYLQSTFWLLVSLQAHILLFLLQKTGIGYRPHWLRRLVGDKAKGHQLKRRSERPEREHVLDFWTLSDDGQLRRPTNSEVDVEVEMRRRLMQSNLEWPRAVPLEEELNDNLYRWWRHGGWWGDLDGSGDYEMIESPQGDDTTSMISYSTDITNSEAEAEWSDIDETGRRTPTQDNPFPARESTPDDTLDTERLAMLLDPQNQEQQQEARMLARRLRNPGAMTRSQYARAEFRERSAVLTSSHSFPHANTSGPFSDEDEERILEALILERRRAHTAAPTAESSSTGANAGAGTPQCVLCQDAPRTILLWPCGHLALCDDCRVNMATRNFSRCVCCRTATVAYSRLYVP